MDPGLIIVIILGIVIYIYGGYISYNIHYGNIEYPAYESLTFGAHVFFFFVNMVTILILIFYIIYYLIQ